MGSVGGWLGSTTTLYVCVCDFPACFSVPSGIPGERGKALRAPGLWATIKKIVVLPCDVQCSTTAHCSSSTGVLMGIVVFTRVRLLFIGCICFFYVVGSVSLFPASRVPVVTDFPRTILAS